MMDSAAAVAHKTNATFNDWDVSRGWTEDDSDVVVLHVIHEWFKFWVNVKV